MKGIIVTILMLPHPLLQMANVSTAGLAQPGFTVLIWKGTNFGARILEGRKSGPV
jgi:hypothetical protein